MQPVIYIMSNHTRSTLYIGVSSNLVQRVYQHKEALVDGFSKRYHCHDLVFYELHESMESAILREKQLKRWRRAKKDALIRAQNPEVKDLYESILQ